MITDRDCPGFDWLTARDARCDRCHCYPWEHDRMMAVVGPDGPLVTQPWPPTLVADWLHHNRITPGRARRLQQPDNPAATPGSNP